MSNVVTRDPALVLGAADEQAIGRLMVAAIHAIDSGSFEDWPPCFTEKCLYRILTRTDHELGRGFGVWFCDTRAMLIDRVSSIRSVNVFEPHVYRHVLGPTEITGLADGVFGAHTNYMLVRTMYDGDMTLFSAGRYLDEIVIESGRALLRARTVVTDSVRYDTMVALPI
jgi:anthranilate 1,2-dioxygenase small subunit